MLHLGLARMGCRMLLVCVVMLQFVFFRQCYDDRLIKKEGEQNKYYNIIIFYITQGAIFFNILNECYEMPPFSAQFQCVLVGFKISKDYFMNICKMSSYHWLLYQFHLFARL